MNSNVLDALDSNTITKRIGFIAFVAAMGAFLDGYDNMVIGAALLIIQPAWKLSAAQVGLLGSIAFLGMAIGGFVFGRLTDKFGRKTSFVLDLSLFVIGGLVSAFATNIAIFTVGRLILGVAIGADVPISTSLIAEISPKNKRGFLTGLMQPLWFFGAFSSTMIAVLFLSSGNNDAWRWAIGLGVVIAVIVMGLRTRIPESPRWLLAQGKNVNTEEIGIKSNEAIRTPDTQNSSLKVLFSKRYAVSLSVVLLFWFLALYRGGTFNSYVPLLLQMFGFKAKLAALEVNAVMYLIYSIVSFFTAMYLDRMGRRSVILIGWAFNVVLTFSLAFVSQNQSIVFVGLLMGSTIFNQIVTTALYPWSVEFFPTMLRATAQGMATGVSRLGALLASFAFPLMQVSFGWTGTVEVVSAIMFAGLIAGIILRPAETDNRSLEDISMSD